MRFLLSLKYCIDIGLSFLLGGCECVCCGTISYVGPICPQCQNNKLLTWVPASNRCSCCGKELISEIGTCIGCREKNLLVHVSKMLPLHNYSGWKKELLSLWKSADTRQLSRVFARVFSSALVKELNPDKVIPLVPVPPRPGKIRKKGWDQIQDICKYLKADGFSILPLLERTNVQQQKKLNRQGRLENLGKTYSIHKKNIRIYGVPKQAIIIDDILTTGVTLETCAGALKEAGVESVFACTLFSVC